MPNISTELENEFASSIKKLHSGLEPMMLEMLQYSAEAGKKLSGMFISRIIGYGSKAESVASVAGESVDFAQAIHRQQIERGNAEPLRHDPSQKIQQREEQREEETQLDTHRAAKKT